VTTHVWQVRFRNGTWDACPSYPDGLRLGPRRRAAILAINHAWLE
jgi:hypothetical protein